MCNTYVANLIFQKIKLLTKLLKKTSNIFKKNSMHLNLNKK